MTLPSPRLATHLTRHGAQGLVLRLDVAAPHPLPPHQLTWLGHEALGMIQERALWDSQAFPGERSLLHTLLETLATIPMGGNSVILFCPHPQAQAAHEGDLGRAGYHFMALSRPQLDRLERLLRTTPPSAITRLGIAASRQSHPRATPRHPVPAFAEAPEQPQRLLRIDQAEGDVTIDIHYLGPVPLAPSHMTELGEAALKMIRRRTSEGMGPPRKDGSPRTLKASGRMLGTMAATVAGQRQVRLACTVEYCRYHHFGTANLPRTQFFSLTDDMTAQLESLARTLTEETLTGSRVHQDAKPDVVTGIRLLWEALSSGERPVDVLEKRHRDAAISDRDLLNYAINNILERQQLSERQKRELEADRARLSPEEMYDKWWKTPVQPSDLMGMISIEAKLGTSFIIDSLLGTAQHALDKENKKEDYTWPEAFEEGLNNGAVGSWHHLSGNK